jgi:hypothetical protein
MSLTTFVELADVKQYLRLNVSKPWFQVQAEIKAPPLSTSYGMTGTAFDYLLRFYIEKLNPFAKASSWVAESSLEILEERPPERDMLRRARRIVQTARELYRSYLGSKGEEKPPEDLIPASIGLAQLDLVYRIGLLELIPIKKTVMNDLRNLLALVNPADFKAKRTCVLNPTFGSASELVGGADADLFLDGTLIDSKTTKHLEMKRDIFNQLLGYYCLSCIGKIEGSRSRVTAIAVYYARYGVLHRIPISSFVDQRFPEVLKWFERTAIEKRARRLEQVQALLADMRRRRAAGTDRV